MKNLNSTEWKREYNCLILEEDGYALTTDTNDLVQIVKLEYYMYCEDEQLVRDFVLVEYLTDKTDRFSNLGKWNKLLIPLEDLKPIEKSMATALYGDIK